MYDDIFLFIIIISGLFYVSTNDLWNFSVAIFATKSIQRSNSSTSSSTFDQGKDQHGSIRTIKSLVFGKSWRTDENYIWLY